MFCETCKKLTTLEAKLHRKRSFVAGRFLTERLAHRFPVKECDQYEHVNDPELDEMKKIAHILIFRHGVPCFLPAEKLEKEHPNGWEVFMPFFVSALWLQSRHASSESLQDE